MYARGLQPAFRPVKITVLFHDGLFPYGRFVPCSNMTLNILTISILMTFHNVRSLNGVHHFYSTLGPRVIMCNLWSLFGSFEKCHLSIKWVNVCPFSSFVYRFIHQAFGRFAPCLHLVMFRFPRPFYPRCLGNLFCRQIPPLSGQWYRRIHQGEVHIKHFRLNMSIGRLLGQCLNFNIPFRLNRSSIVPFNNYCLIIIALMFHGGIATINMGLNVITRVRRFRFSSITICNRYVNVSMFIVNMGRITWVFVHHHVSFRRTFNLVRFFFHYNFRLQVNSTRNMSCHQRSIHCLFMAYVTCTSYGLPCHHQGIRRIVSYHTITRSMCLTLLIMGITPLRDHQNMRVSFTRHFIKGSSYMDITWFLTICLLKYSTHQASSFRLIK